MLGKLAAAASVLAAVTVAVAAVADAAYHVVNGLICCAEPVAEEVHDAEAIALYQPAVPVPVPVPVPVLSVVVLPYA